MFDITGDKINSYLYNITKGVNEKLDANEYELPHKKLVESKLALPCNEKFLIPPYRKKVNIN